MPTLAPPELSAPFAPGGEAAIDAVLAQRLLAAALESGGDAADLYFEYRVTADYALQEEKVKSVGRGVTLGLGVRVTKGDATGYAFTEDLAWERMVHAARIAGQIATGGGRAQPVAAHPVTLPDYYPVQRLSLVEPPADKLALLYAADKAARAADPRIVKVEASLVEQIKEVLVISSDGRMARDVQPLMRFGVSAVAEDGGKRQAGSSGGGGRFGLDYFAQPGKDAVSHGREAARVAIAMLDAREAPAGEMPVVLAAGDSGILLHEAVGHGLEADFNRKETSNYTGQLGKPVASALCTVVDDGTIGASRGSINVDDEGYASGRHVLIENGILVGYMHDRLSAKHFGVSPGGNGRRESFRSMPLPRMTNTLLMPGPHAPEEIIASVKRGIYAKRFSGGQVNISNGDFVFSLTESYLIEDGKLTAPLKGVNLIGNGPEAMRKVDMLGTDFELSDGIWTCGKDGQSVPVGVGTPSCRISGITVGGTQA
ncbi:MAG: metalloprotease TldD [Myxococcales bacterium]|nr:metalloprotease TldD [Myxococcales bacterium]MBK7194251.1 metalloprotease TldD [Myxococcales bacterium]MBP6843336.1 metalloprotease TldD [Kofleriaceae bacterium]